ncbi:unnamed protein product [Sphagnum balticum]
MASFHATTTLLAPARRLIASKFTANSLPNLLGIREIHTTGAKHYNNDYLHADQMYNLPVMKHRTRKMFIAVFGIVLAGSAVPLLAVHLQMKKQGAGSATSSQT